VRGAEARLAVPQITWAGGRVKQNTQYSYRDNARRTPASSTIDLTKIPREESND
jgi:hypothetical protein